MATGFYVQNHAWTAVTNAPFSRGTLTPLPCGPIYRGRPLWACESHEANRIASYRRRVIGPLSKHGSCSSRRSECFGIGRSATSPN
jgi:hypothetical protein